MFDLVESRRLTIVPQMPENEIEAMNFFFDATDRIDWYIEDDGESTYLYWSGENDPDEMVEDLEFLLEDSTLAQYGYALGGKIYFDDDCEDGIFVCPGSPIEYLSDIYY